MKKSIVLLMMVVMLMSGFVPAHAQVASIPDADIMLDEDLWLTSSAYVEGVIYLTGNGKLMSFHPGDEEVKELTVKDLRADRPDKGEGQQDAEEFMNYNMRLFSMGDQLYGYDLQGEAMIYTLGIEGDIVSVLEGVEIQVDMLRNMEWGDEGYIEEPTQVLAHMGRLYMVKVSWNMNVELGLYSYDIAAGGEPTSHEAEFIWRLSPYKDGKLLALVMDPDSAYDEQKKEMKNFTLGVYDPQADSMEVLGDSGIQFDYDGGASVLYDAQQDAIYFQGRSELYVRDAAGKLQEAAYLIPSQYGNNSGDGMFRLPGGEVALVRAKSIAIRQADPSTLPSGRLTIYGTYMDETHQRAMAAMAGVPVNFLERSWYGSAQELGQALVSGEDAIDIFVLNSSYIDLHNLMSKGYAADLSASQAIADYVQELYPDMQEVGTYDGKLLMIPVDVQGGDIMSYYTKMFDGIEGVELPSTYDDLIDLIQRWNDELGENYPDILPMHSDDYVNTMVRRAIGMRMNELAAQGEEFSYGDPLLKEMLTRALALRTEDISPKVDWDSNDAQEMADEIYNKAPLMQEYFTLELSYINYNLTSPNDDRKIGFGNGAMYDIGIEMPLILASSQEQEPIVPLNLSVMAVNPKSKNLEAAIAYVEQYTKSLDLSKKAMMNPHMNDDIPNPNYEQEIKWVDEGLVSMEEALKTAEGAQKTELESAYEQFKATAEKRKEEAKYSVRKETIAFYRELIEHRNILTYESQMPFRNEDMGALVRRLVDGQMPLDQFLMEADGKLRLMRLERQ